MGYYDVAQICMNGHLINDSINKFPEHNQNFCTECAAPTITTCPQCKGHIRGCYRVEGFIGHIDYKIPKYCHLCGAPYPWMEDKLKAAAELIKEFEEIDQEEKTQLTNAIEEMAKDTANSQVASLRYKRIMTKVSKEAGLMLRDIITDIISETIRKTIFGI